MFEMPTEAEPVRVIEGDCLEALKTLPDGCVDAVITDPPYGIGLESHSPNICTDGTRRLRKRETRVTGDSDIELAMSAVDWSDSRGLTACLFASPYRPLPGEWRNVLVWDKGPAVGGGGDPWKCWKRTVELIYTRRNGELREGRDEAVLRFHVGTGDDFEFHPCQKPVPLMRYLIRQLTAPGDVVLDPFGGSGTTAVACIAEGRRCIIVEKEPRYVDIIHRRVAEAMGMGKGSLLKSLPAESLFAGVE